MKRIYITLVLVACGLFFGAPSLHAHGGTYLPPGDIVPPGGLPSAPPTTGPPDTGPITPPRPNPPPTDPNGPPTPPNPWGPPSDHPGVPNRIATQPSGPPPVDLSTWVFWWEFNKARFLDLKAKVRGAGNVTEVGSLVGLGHGAGVAQSFAPSRAQCENSIIPALLELAAQENNRDVTTAVMLALAKVGLDGAAARPLFENNLDSPVQEISETAALAYGILRDELSIPLLVELLRDTKDAQQVVGRSEVPLRSRTFAAYSLGLIASGSNDDRIKNEIAEVLLDMLTTDQSAAKDIRVACVIAVGVLDLQDPTMTVTRLGEILDADQDSDLILAHIPNAMAKLLREAMPGDMTRDATIDQLFGILSNKPKRKVAIRQSAVQALGMLATANDPRNRSMYDLLTTLAKKGRDVQLKHYTAIALADLGTADMNLRGDVVKFLMDNMKRSSTPFEPWCGLALGVMAFNLQGQDEFMPPIAIEATLAKFRKTKAPQRKAAFALALGLMEHHAAADELQMSVARIRDSEFRGYALLAMGLMDARQHTGFISEIIMDSKRDPDLLRQASIALGLMKNRNAVGLLLTYLNPEGNKRPRLTVLAAVATALGFIGDKDSVKPLVDTMSNQRITALGRAFAAVSLGMVADKDDMPWNSVFSENLNYRAAVSTLVDQQTGTGILDIL